MIERSKNANQLGKFLVDRFTGTGVRRRVSQPMMGLRLDIARMMTCYSCRLRPDPGGR